VRQLEAGEARVENAYSRAVRREGNPAARALLEDVFVVADRSWRGLGHIPRSGYVLAPRYAAFDAERVFEVAGIAAREPRECRAGLVLQGRLDPPECPEFGGSCTPEHPLGAPMVSAEGACAAYFRYRGVELPLVRSGG
jgi:hydrogenase expression/formation protein HypD